MITIVVAGDQKTPLVLVISLYFLSFAFIRIESKSKLNTQSYEYYYKIQNKSFNTREITNAKINKSKTYPCL